MSEINLLKNCLTLLTGTTNIFKAAEEGQLKDVIFLIETGSSPNETFDKNNEKNLLDIAAEQGYFDILIYLIEKGAKLNSKSRYGGTALHCASEKGHLKVVKCLIKKGADVNAKDQFERTALHLVSANGHLEIVQYLIGKGASKREVAKFLTSINK